MTENFTFNWTGLGGREVPDRQHVATQPGPAGFRAGHRRPRFNAGVGLVRRAVGDGVLRALEEVVCDRGHAVRGRAPRGLTVTSSPMTGRGLAGRGCICSLGHVHTLALQAVVSGESKGQDTMPGMTMDDTAVTSVFLGPQISLHLVEPAERPGRG